MGDTYYIRIKKDYAISVIEDLEKMEAVELLNNNEFNVPDWQVQLGKEEIKKIYKNPVLLTDWEKAKEELKL